MEGIILWIIFSLGTISALAIILFLLAVVTKQRKPLMSSRLATTGVVLGIYVLFVYVVYGLFVGLTTGWNPLITQWYDPLSPLNSIRAFTFSFLYPLTILWFISAYFVERNSHPVPFLYYVAVPLGILSLIGFVCAKLAFVPTTPVDPIYFLVYLLSY